jgi:hypothetical protein
MCNLFLTMMGQLVTAWSTSAMARDRSKNGAPLFRRVAKILQRNLLEAVFIGNAGAAGNLSFHFHKTRTI